MPLVSHRGAGGLAVENSLESIKIGQSYKPAFIEVDVQCTRDGVFVLYHGKIQHEISGGRRGETYEQLTKLAPTLLTLKELLAKKIDTPLMIDIKSWSDVQALIEILKKTPPPAGSGFTCPHSATLHKVAEAFPEAPTMIAQPYHVGPIRPVDIARKRHFTGVSINKWWTSPFLVWLCRRYNLTMMVYTIDNSTWLWIVQKLFKNAYICTNRPDRYRKHFPVTQ